MIGEAPIMARQSLVTTRQNGYYMQYGERQVPLAERQVGG